MAELDGEGSLAALEDVMIRLELVSMVDASADDVCERLGCGMTVLTSTELCGMITGKEVDRLEGGMAVDDSTGSSIEDGEAIAELSIADETTEKTAEVSREVADVSMLEDSIERIVDVAGVVVEESVVEVIIDCTWGAMDVVTGTEEVAEIVGATIVDEGTVVEGDVGLALDEAAASEEASRAVEKVTVVDDDVGAALDATATPGDVAWTVDKAVDGEDGVGTALEERSSALIMSAAFARMSDYTK